VNETLTVPTPDGDMGIHIVRPDGDGPFPVIVFFHHGPGLDDASKSTMEMIAERGYYVISHDRYHRESPWFVMTPEMRQDPEAAQKFFGVLIGTSDDMVDSDLAAVLTHIDGDPAARGGAMACIGYCIGARSVVVTMARHTDRFAAGVGMHPSYCTTDQPDSPHLLLDQIKGEMLYLFAETDPSVPDNVIPTLQTGLERGSVKHRIKIFPGTQHGFQFPERVAYAAAASEQAWTMMFDLWDRNLK